MDKRLYLERACGLNARPQRMRNGVRLFFLFACALLLACGASGDPPRAPGMASRTAAHAAALRSPEAEQELRQAFADAVFYCDAYLLEPVRAARVSGAAAFRSVPALCAGGGCTDDPLLAAYAERPPSSLSQESPHGPVRPVTRRIDTAALVTRERNANACADAVQGYGSPRDAQTSPAPGLCRADFNYCVAQQLRLKADSVARPPGSRQAREAIVHEARNRFAVSAGEHARALAWVDDRSNSTCPEYRDEWRWNGQTKTAYRAHAFTHQRSRACSTTGCVCPGSDGGYDCIICQAWLRGCTQTAEQDAQAICSAAQVQEELSLRNFVINPAASHRQGGCSADASYTRGIPESARSSIDVTAGTPGSNPFSRNVSCRRSERHAAGSWVQVCVSDAYQRERLRVQAGYGELALERINDALGQIQALAEDEVRVLLGDADATPLVDITREGSYGAAVWGESSPRLAAARALTGTHPLSPAALVFADAPVGDDAARVALRLIVELGARLPYTAEVVRDDQGAPSGVGQVSWPRPSDAALQAAGAEAFADLAALLAARTGLSAAEGAAILRDDYRIDERHAARALRLLDDQLRTLDLDFAFVLPALPPPDGESSVRPAIALRNPVAAQRSPLPLASALTARALWPPSALTTSYFDSVGVAGTVHYLRERLLGLGQKTRLRPWSGEARLQSALAFSDALVGERWSTAIFNPTTRLQTLRRYAPEAAGQRSYHYTADPDIDSCLRFGHRPGVPDDDCLASVQPASAPVVGSFHGRRYEQFTFTVPEHPEGAPPYFILARSCSGADCAFEIVDVIDPELGQIHAFGGRVLELLGEVLAKSPQDPAYPQLNSLGLNTEFVPAFRTLDAGTTATAEFHMRRLARAEEAVARAAARVELARNYEETYIRTQSQQVDARERAEQGAREQIANACGFEAGPELAACEVPRRPEVTMAELALVQTPAEVPRTRDGRLCDAYELVLQAPASGDAATLRAALGDALTCTHWKVKQTAADTLLLQVPEPVVTALQSSVPRGEPGPTFAEYGGDVQVELLNYYQALLDVRHGLEDFEQGHHIASQAFDVAIDRIGDLDQSEWEKWQCRIGLGLQVLETAAKVYVAAQTGAALPTVSGERPDLGHAETTNLIGQGLSTAAAIERCDDPNEDAQTDLARAAFFDVARALDTMRAAGHAAERMITITALADNRLDAIVRGVGHAQERIDLEQRIAARDPVLAAPIWRRLRGETVTRAKLDLLTAQRRLFEARRAIEYRTATRLRAVATTVGDAIPAGWSDDLFAIEPFQPEVALDDYAVELRGFVAGYADAYNFNELSETAPSLSLAGILTNALDEQGRLSVPFARRLWFKCRDEAALLLGGVLPGENGEPCATRGGAQWATLSFTVPPGFGAYLREVLPDRRVNHVYAGVALNFRGTGLRNCERATDPDACYGSISLSYSLVQDSDTILRSLDGALHAFDLRPGFILDAPGLANELRLSDQAAQQLIDQNPDLRRNELAARPLIGRHTLVIEGRPEIDWLNLEDVEIQLGYRAWSAAP